MRIALADDSLLFREGLARLLVEGGFEVAGQASDADRLLALVDSTVPDVAIVDIRMPPDHRDEGLAAARAIKEHHPGVGVLVLSQYVEPDYALALVDDRPRGAGYLLKDRVEDLDTLAASIRRIAAGEVVIDPSVVALLVNRARTHDPLDELTRAGARGSPADGRGTVQPRDLGPAVPDRADGRVARPEHISEAEPSADERRPPARAGSAQLLAGQLVQTAACGHGLTDRRRPGHQAAGR